jgi:hypothetical protein
MADGRGRKLGGARSFAVVPTGTADFAPLGARKVE